MVMEAGSNPRLHTRFIALNWASARQETFEPQMMKVLTVRSRDDQDAAYQGDPLGFALAAVLQPGPV